ncbi:MAG: hypothetical protein ABR568_22195, partial [Pyrinomonadaceae bacterium]
GRGSGRRWNLIVSSCSSLHRSDMFIADESLSRRHSVRSAMFGTVYIALLAERRQYQAVDVYKHFTPPE